MLDINDKAPDITLEDENGKEVSLKDFKGKTVVLYFYPKADTPGWTWTAPKQLICTRQRVEANAKGAASSQRLGTGRLRLARA